MNVYLVGLRSEQNSLRNRRIFLCILGEPAGYKENCFETSVKLKFGSELTRSVVTPARAAAKQTETGFLAVLQSNQDQVLFNSPFRLGYELAFSYPTNSPKIKKTKHKKTKNKKALRSSQQSKSEAQC